MPTNEQKEWDHEFLNKLVDLIDPTRRFGENFNPVFVHLVDDTQYEVIFSVHFWEGSVVAWQSAQFSGLDARLHAFEFAHGLPEPKTVFNLTIDKDPVSEGQS